MIAEAFGGYYRSMAEESLHISDLRHRELAFLQFGEKVMIRHMAFDDECSLKAYVGDKPPAHLYYSSAYYSFPSDPSMSKKIWLGADLVFDIDADHIPTPCKMNHDKWICLDCGAKGGGFPPECCPSCGRKRIDTRTWVCEECLKVAKNEIFKLVEEFLLPDFGLSTDEIEINFSGHRGYHLHVISEALRPLTNDGRREIADYVRAIGLDQELQGFKKLGNNEPLIGPDLKDSGWRGRIARALYEYIKTSTAENLEFVIGPPAAKWFIKNREDLLSKISGSPSWWGGLTPVRMEHFRKIAKEAINGVVCNIDERVTIDTKRLIRYPNSLHGKSGLKACRVAYGDLDRFDPLKDAIAFEGSPVKVYVREIPRIRIGDEEIGPIEKEAEVEVSRAMGIYLICRGAAEPRLWSDV